MKPTKEEKYQLTGEIFFINIKSYSFSICKTDKSLFSKRYGYLGKNVLGYNFCLQKNK